MERIEHASAPPAGFAAAVGRGLRWLTVLCAALPPPAGAQCPPATNFSTRFLLMHPETEGTYDGSLAVMVDDAVTTLSHIPVRVTVPACSSTPNMLYPSPDQAAVLQVCDAARFTAVGPWAGFAITVERAIPYGNELSVVYKANYEGGSSDDAYLVLPESRLGDAYWSLSYQGAESIVRYPTRQAYLARDPLTLSFATCAGGTATATLNAGDAFQNFCLPNTTVNEHGTGFRVFSTPGQAFAYFTGATCSDVPPTGTPCDTLLEMMPPESWGGTEYFVTEFPKVLAPPGSGVGDLVRILAIENGADVHVASPGPTPPAPDGSSAHACPSGSNFVLNAGEWCDLSIEGGARIWTQAAIGPPSRILVGHFMKAFSITGTGDSSFTQVIPTSRFVCNHRFFSFRDYGFEPATLNGSYVNIVAPAGVIANIKLDGVRIGSGTTCLDYAATTYPSGGHAWAHCRLADPPPGSPGIQHTIDTSAAPGATVGAYAYGQRFCGSYAYMTGIAF